MASGSGDDGLTTGATPEIIVVMVALLSGAAVDTAVLKVALLGGVGDTAWLASFCGDDCNEWLEGTAVFARPVELVDAACI